MQKIAVIGLGYVGLPLLCLCAEKGMKAIGIDIDSKKVDLLKEGKSPIDDESLNKQVPELKDSLEFSTEVESAIKDTKVIFVCAPTPVDKNHKPDLGPVKEACESVSKGLQDGTTIIIESTIFPGTVEEIIKPILDKSGVSYYLAHCPERLDPGNKKFNLNNIPRVIGGINEESTKKSAEWYRKIIDAEVTELSSVKAAEATKIMENTFRDVNIAFINEMAMSFDKMGVDVLEVIRGAATKPFAFMPHYPGVGVGGHCIPVDPYYLIEKAKESGFHHEFLSLAREINNNMPTYTVGLLEEELKKINKSISDIAIGVLGVAYKKNVDDMRESPAIKVLEVLKEKQARVEIFDPFILESSTTKNTEELLSKVDALIIGTDHDAFLDIPLEKYKESGIKILIDGRNCFDKQEIKELGIQYRGIGRS